MKVLIVTQYFWPENFKINDLAAGLGERGNEVTVLTGIPNYPNGSFFQGYGIFRNMRQKYNGANVFRVPLIPRGKGTSTRLVLNYFSFVLFSCFFSLFLSLKKFDVIFVFEPSPITVGLPAIIVKKIKKIPLIFWVLDLWPESLSATGAVNSRKILEITDKLVRFIYGCCDKILIQSQAFLHSITSKGVTPEKIVYFPNSVEDIYKPTHNLPDPGFFKFRQSDFYIMFAGNIGVAQDFETIISAAEKLKTWPDIHWVILGDGRRFEWVKNEVDCRNLSGVFHLLGRHPLKSMPCFFAEADIMLVTLKKEPIFALTIPAKIQSYMACAKPIVAALDGEGARILLDSGCGLAAPSEDAGKLAESILEMYHMPKNVRQQMGMRGKIYCEINFGRKILIDRLEQIMMESVQKLRPAKE